MSVNPCENCSSVLFESEKICKACGYPQKGTKAEKISYNGKLIRMRDLIEDSDKSVKGILSFAIIFLFMALVVLSFSLLFKEDHYTNVLVFGAIGLVYFLLYRLGKKSSYLMIILALFFYLGHSIFEFSNGMFLKSPVDMDESFLESRGASLVFTMIPIGYMILRMALMIVLGKYLWTQLKLKKDEKMVRFIRSH
jgi:hypothetical protein